MVYSMVRQESTGEEGLSLPYQCSPNSLCPGNLSLFGGLYQPQPKVTLEGRGKCTAPQGKGGGHFTSLIGCGAPGKLF